MKLRTFVLAGLLCIPLLAKAQVTVSVAPDAASKEDVKHLLNLMVSPEQMRQVMQQVYVQMRTVSLERLKKEHPEMSEAELARAERQSDEFMKNFPLEQMLDDLIPIYQKHFSKSDIDGLVAFYSSPTGQKYLHEMPAITAETMQAIFPRIEAAVAAARKQSEKPQQ